MAKHLDLEEQEQLAELKHFWNKWGNLISVLLIVVFGGIAAWNGWNWWQRHQGTQASALFEEVERAAQAKDLERIKRATADIQEQYARTAYAQQATLLAAKAWHEAGQPDAARSALAWVAGKARDPGYQAVARLRLAALLADQKSYDDALQQLAGSMPAEFEPLAADRRGDILLLQGKKAEAIAAYQKAWAGLAEQPEYRRIVEVKLASLGGEVAKS
ncbi:tetratricopeptide repeat protein [Ramlibacter sp. AW1]|uniref:Ancillary SecYEG translocon subunit n=1 Tax=Ramlibacter aurantiacus TaxID=2801330 RepID=A0A937D4T1_9BURK|nr:tetratricopeptide repeat protein [Ramlibacter aurantiacus]MBL0422045.1 tetratricopeptide repeat protein [Ramlibacter aurantiacus]